MTRIVFAGGGTGGHLYPGIAIARALVKADSRIEPFFVGALRGVERDVLPKTEFPHLLLDLHPIYRPAVWNNWKTVLGAVGSWRKVGKLFRERPPALVVGTGGYAAGLTLAYAVVHRVPMVQQAGDSHPGITARSFSRFSREIYLAFPEAARVLKAHHEGSLVDTGAPIEPPPNPRPDRAAARERWGFPATGGHVLLVYGGSQGSLAINRAVAEMVGQGLPEGLHVIWATGRTTYAEFAHLDAPRLRVVDYLAPIGDAYAATDVALCRAGAMTTAELFAWGIPAVLVPLPTAAADHQSHNARVLQEAGAAIHLPQSELTAAKLVDMITGLLRDPARMEALARGASARARPNAASDIASRILALVRP